MRSGDRRLCKTYRLKHQVIRHDYPIPSTSLLIEWILQASRASLESRLVEDWDHENIYQYTMDDVGRSRIIEAPFDSGYLHAGRERAAKATRVRAPQCRGAKRTLSLVFSQAPRSLSGPDRSLQAGGGITTCKRLPTFARTSE